MTREFLVVGSGDSAPVDTHGRECLFVNSAVLRAVGCNLLDLIITTGLLSTDSELKAAKNVDGLNAVESFKLRKAKIDAFRKHNIRNLYVVTNEAKQTVVERLAQLGVKFERLECISRRQISMKILLMVVFRLHFKLDLLKLFVWNLIGSVCDIKIPPRYRPSTGGIAVLMIAQELKLTGGCIRLNGIGCGDRGAFYPDASGKLEAQKYNNIHWLPDKLIFDGLDNFISR